MKLLYSIHTDLKKSIFSLGFIACAAVTAILCMTSNGYHDRSANINYSVFEAILYIDWQTLAENGVTGINIIKFGLSGYCTMFMPIIAALPFVTAFCNERNTGSIRLNIVRTGKLRYYIGKFISAVISAGLAVTLGCAVFAAIVYPIFPTVDDCKEMSTSFFIEENFSIATELWHFFSGAFIYGAVSVLPAFFMSSFVKNHYIITCVPFMLAYIQKVALNKISQAHMTDAPAEGLSIFEKCSAFYPENITQWYSESSYVPLMLKYNGICIAAALIGFIVIMNLRRDKGE